MIAALRREVHGGGKPVPLKQRKRPRLEIKVAIVEGQRHGAIGQCTLIQPLERFTQRKHMASGASQRVQPTGERRRRHVQLRVPFVLVA